MQVDDTGVEQAAAVIWSQTVDLPWSNATPEQQRRYIAIARSSLIHAGAEGPYRLTAAVSGTDGAEQ